MVDIGSSKPYKLFRVALYTLQAFVPNLWDVHVRLKLDNSTVVAYINKMGGIKSPSLNSLSRTLCKWCTERNIIISAQHIPGKDNLVADSLPREFSSNLEWSVDIDIFNQMTNMTFVPDIDLLYLHQDLKEHCHCILALLYNAKICLCINGNTKLMMQFCYQRLYHYIETIYCCLSLSMARMKMGEI